MFVLFRIIGEFIHSGYHDIIITDVKREEWKRFYFRPSRIVLAGIGIAVHVFMFINFLKVLPYVNEQDPWFRGFEIIYLLYGLLGEALFMAWSIIIAIEEWTGRRDPKITGWYWIVKIVYDFFDKVDEEAKPK